MVKVTSTFKEIMDWFISSISSLSFLESTEIYDSDYLITPSTKLPAIAVQRGEIRPSLDEEQCIGSIEVSSDITVTLHIPPANVNYTDPLLYYFEEQIILKILTDYLYNSNKNINSIELNESRISNIFLETNDSIFSHISKIKFNINFTLKEDSLND